MSQFQILDEKRYPLKIKDINKDILPYWRYEHRVTIGASLRKFMAFVDNLTCKLYIEEITDGHLKIIEEETIWHDLYRFCDEKGFCNMLQPMLKHTAERAV
jgi:hypothetical protein